MGNCELSARLGRLEMSTIENRRPFAINTESERNIIISTSSHSTKSQEKVKYYNTQRLPTNWKPCNPQIQVSKTEKLLTLRHTAIHDWASGKPAHPGAPPPEPAGPEEEYSPVL